MTETADKRLPGCEGAFHDCAGAVRRVHVVDGKTQYDWGNFRYCDEAVKMDRDQGFVVTEEPA